MLSPAVVGARSGLFLLNTTLTLTTSVVLETTVSAERRNRLTIAVGLCARNAPIICREKAVRRLGYCAAHYEHARAFSRQLMRAFRAHKPTVIESVDKDCVEALPRNQLKHGTKLIHVE
jgi:hypothetical protein